MGSSFQTILLNQSTKEYEENNGTLSLKARSASPNHIEVLLYNFQIVDKEIVNIPHENDCSR